MKKWKLKSTLTGSFLALFLMTGQAQAALWDFSITGTINNILGCDAVSCPFGLSVPGDAINVTGSYDDFYLYDNGYGDGTFVDFYDTGSMSISFGDTSYTTPLDFYWLPILDFDLAGNLTGLDAGAETLDGFGYQISNLVSSYLNFSNLLFDDYGVIIGEVTGTWGSYEQWDPTVGRIIDQPSAVPVPAAIWLFGTALLGLVGFSKRKDA